MRKATPPAYLPTLLTDLPPELIDALRARHAEPQRHYHDWSHVEALLRHKDSVAARLHDPDAVTLAILFHDAVYDPRASDNERQSAALLLEYAPPVAPSTLQLAHGMVLATDGHRMPDVSGADAGDTAHFLDMDLAILGAHEARFDIYESQIRREYAHVPDHAFRTGRLAVLQGFAARVQLYFSAWGRDRFEARARANLARSIAQLGG